MGGREGGRTNVRDEEIGRVFEGEMERVNARENKEERWPREEEIVIEIVIEIVCVFSHQLIPLIISRSYDRID